MTPSAAGSQPKPLTGTLLEAAQQLAFRDHRRAAIESDLAPLVSSPQDQAMAKGIAAALAEYGVEGVDLGPQS